VPETRGFLTVSASHLPPAFAEILLQISAESTKGIVLAGASGFLVFARGEHPEYPQSVQKLLAYAAADLDSSFVLFDSDGDVLDDFPTYDDEN